METHTKCCYDVAYRDYCTHTRSHARTLSLSRPGFILNSELRFYASPLLCHSQGRSACVITAALISVVCIGLYISLFVALLKETSVIPRCHQERDNCCYNKTSSIPGNGNIVMCVLRRWSRRGHSRETFIAVLQVRGNKLQPIPSLMYEYSYILVHPLEH
jgi:hypothetical protein